MTKKDAAAIGAKFYFSVFIFTFLNYPVFKNYKFLNPPLQRRGIFENVLYFENNRRSLRSRQKPRKFLKKRITLHL
jgi:hypothetical protein